MLHAVWHWLLTVTGSNNTSGTWYGFWSGFAGDIPLFGIVFVVYKKLNCHAPGCWRFGFHHVNGTPYITCKKHHPTNGTTMEQIHKAYRDNS